MQEALYHPAFGYYSARVRRIGREGDFSTSATLHPALGRAIAAWAASHAAEARSPGRRGWHIIELGGGNGALALEVLRSLGALSRWGLTYHIVEVSRELEAAQRSCLSGFARRVRWHEDIASALQQANGRALIFSNEFVDAFPCVQLRWDAVAGTWREVCVQWLDGAARPGETFSPWPRAGDLEPGASSALQMRHPPGQRIEVHLSFRRWLKSWRHLWHSGRMLTIDYGDEAGALYHRRPQGTLRAYCQQQRFTGLELYERFGQQDLTADVNFTDLQQWGEELGLATKSLLTQRAFLEKWLPSQTLQQAVGDPSLSFLLDEAGAGTAFKMLEQIPTFLMVRATP